MIWGCGDLLIDLMSWRPRDLAIESVDLPGGSAIHRLAGGVM
jgi:hypothetical protein